MKILVTGSSGLIGSQLIPYLVARGHAVVRLVRSETGRDGDAIRWDPVVGTLDRAAVEGLDAVVHLAGEDISSGTWTAAKKARIRQSRVEGTGLLARTLASLDRRPHVFACASATGYYGDRGDEILTEESEPGTGFLASVCRDWEEAATPAAAAGIRVAHLRLGVVLSADGGALARMLGPFRLGLGGPLGSGRQYVSWVAMDDTLGAIGHVLSTQALRGAVNVASPKPVTHSEFARTLGRVLGRPTVLGMPAFAARLMFGEMADEVLLASQRLGPARLLAPAGRMVLRDLGRRPVRALLSSLGLAFAVAILVVALFTNDALDVMFARVFGAEREDATVTFTTALSEEAVVELRRYPGILRAEPFRAFPATLRSGHRTYRTALTGVDPGAELTRMVDADGGTVPLPPEGLVLSAKLAEILGVHPGGEVVAEVLEGRRPVRTLPVATVVEDFLGVRAIASRAWLDEMLGEAPLVSGAYLAVDAAAAPALQASLRAAPRVAGVTMRGATIAAYRRQIESFLFTYLGIVAALALAIAVGVVYSAARVTYAERERELATLRVVGFTRGEVWRIVAGEMSVHVAAALPAGCLIGLAFVHAAAARSSTDLYRLPTVVERGTYATSMIVVAVAAAAVLLVALRWVRRIDLVEVLKSRE